MCIPSNGYALAPASTLKIVAEKVDDLPSAIRDLLDLAAVCYLAGDYFTGADKLDAAARLMRQVGHDQQIWLGMRSTD